MRILEINEDMVIFDNGSRLFSSHCPDCCEYNYADFEALKDTIAEDVDFSINLKFEEDEWGCGFLFGDDKVGMFFVPCYSAQNGYYSRDVDIYYNNEIVLSPQGELI